MFSFFKLFMNAKENSADYEEIKQALEAKLKRVYTLLDASAMPDDVKISWKSLLPQMTLQQVDRLIALLEKELTETLAAMKKYGQPEKELLTELARIKKDEEKQRGALHKKTISQLDDLSQQLSDLEKSAQ